jgi:RNA polymerase sigma-70 factor (ECF subfamily)
MPADAPADCTDDDLPLVRRAQAGDMDAFDSLVGKYQPMMTGMLHRFAPVRADLEDLVQETFVRAWRGLAQWRAEKPFVHWLKRIAANVGLEFCRRRACTPFARLTEPDEHPLENIPAETDAGEGARHAAEEAHFILSQLPPEDRALLTLLHLEEMPLAEIAGHFGWSRANAKIKAFRARHRLRKLLNRHGYTLE